MTRPISFITACIVTILFVIFFDVYGFEYLSSVTELLLIPLFALFYFIFNKAKVNRLICFFGFYALADIINLIDYSAISNWAYYVCNGIYIIAYSCLIYYILSTLCFKLVLKRFLLDFIVLLALDLYMIYVLINIVKPLEFESNYTSIIHIVEFLYSLILILVFSLSYLNYIQNGLKKYLFLFIAFVLIAFSELILVGYYYLLDDVRLNYMSTTLYVCGVFAMYYHTLSTTKKGQINLVEAIEY